MRPAVHANILRHRSQRSRRVTRLHTFSMRRLLLLAFVGALFFIPGVVITIVWLEQTEENMEAMVPSNQMMYRVVGPAMMALGLVVLFSSCIYYYCYGAGESSRLTAGSFQGSVISDPDVGSVRSKTSQHHSLHQYGHLQQNNGSQLNSPDSTTRWMSTKDDDQSCTPMSPNEDRLLLSQSDESGRMAASPPPAIRVFEAQEIDNPDIAAERDHLMNGAISKETPSV